ncbi:hypothetical protein EVAR_75337_1 [Eumeta japonica]|uniref:Zasp-like motif domain-containing protein n=1 Tax=Eumeta variegata TaxID=151549 RepID=A0A4C1Y016_EUMVA|nr:hypothetical protein EVAR_75337_1 [Eumeta japonica]
MSALDPHRFAEWRPKWRIASVVTHAHENKTRKRTTTLPAILVAHNRARCNLQNGDFAGVNTAKSNITREISYNIPPCFLHIRKSMPYRTTPLVLPGAKVRREPGPTESYLRHHPNPSMRAPPHHDYRDTLMKQKVAESVLHRVVGEDAGNKVFVVVHKQFNSPINLYSEANIANSIRQHSSPVPPKPSVLYDPAKSETYRALQEEGLGDVVQEVPTPVQPKVFQAPTNKVPLLDITSLAIIIYKFNAGIKPVTVLNTGQLNFIVHYVLSRSLSSDNIYLTLMPPLKIDSHTIEGSKPVPTPKPTKQNEAKPKFKQTTFVSKLTERRAHPTVELVQATHVPRARGHGVLAANNPRGAAHRQPAKLNTAT